MRTFLDKRNSKLKALKTSLVNYLEIIHEKDGATVEVLMVARALDYISEAINALDFIKEVQQK